MVEQDLPSNLAIFLLEYPLFLHLQIKNLSLLLNFEYFGILLTSILTSMEVILPILTQYGGLRSF